MPTLTSERSSSAITIQRGAYSSFPWSQINIQVFDSAGNPVSSVASGTVSGAVRANNSSKLAPFDNTINLATEDWYWLPQQAAVDSFVITPSGLPSGYTIQVTVSNWGRDDA